MFDALTRRVRAAARGLVRGDLQSGPAAGGDPDPIRFIEDLDRTFKRAEPAYDKRQRQIDFRTVFVTGGATPEQAARVLYLIFRWAGMFGPGPLDAQALQRREGARFLCFNILSVLNAEPLRTDPEDAAPQPDNR